MKQFEGSCPYCWLMVRSIHKVQVCLLVLDRGRNNLPLACFSSIVPALVFQTRVSNQVLFVLKGFLVCFCLFVCLFLTRAFKLIFSSPQHCQHLRSFPLSSSLHRRNGPSQSSLQPSTSLESLYSLI